MIMLQMQDDHSDENDNDDAEYRDDDDEGALGLGKWVMMMGQALLGTLYQEVWRTSESGEHDKSLHMGRWEVWGKSRAHEKSG